ncbi:helix-turn-helix domain-containing protein [Nocardia nova]|uniref:MmyB family transcriptional regulator n=1 Tax=Nocardia nova TaxID=37330 RepID=UPI0011B2889D|nr:helix-turn-helix domain-containing protein [Nocardia nova]
MRTDTDDPVCARCAGALFAACFSCGRFSADSRYISGGHRACPRCASRFHACPECGTLVQPGHGCEGCAQRGKVWNYTYRPDPRFHGTGPLYLGLELEIIVPEHRFDTCAGLATDQLGGLGYLKRDSSIRPSGFELVSHESAQGRELFTISCIRWRESVGVRGGFMTTTPGSPYALQPPEVARLAGDVPVRIPTLGSWLRVMREHRDLTREQAGQYTHVSAAYLKSVETGAATPRRHTLDKIITGYELTPIQSRHTIDLWEPAAVLAPLDELRERIATPGRRAELATWEARSITCGFCDPLWNVVAANRLFRSMFPGLDQAENNLAIWRFSSPGEPSHPGTAAGGGGGGGGGGGEEDAQFFVATLRAALGRFRHAPEGARLLQRLAASTHFAALWRSGVEVAYDGGPSPRRSGDHNAPVTVQVAELIEEPGVRLFLAYRSHTAGRRGPDGVGAQPVS